MAQAEIAVAVASLAIEAFNAIKSLFELNDQQHERESAWTQSFVSATRAKYPDKNVLVAHAPPHVNPSFQGVVASDHYELPLPGPFNQTQGYDYWVFDSGDFERRGDGGFINWCFAGNWTRGSGNQDNHLHFEPIKRDDPPLPPLPPPVPTPQRSHPDGVYFVNCRRGNEVSSGLAYYKHMKDGGNEGQRPDDYVDVTHGNFVTWERPGLGIYHNGTRFHWDIYGNAKEKRDFEFVGTADNTFVRFKVYKDRQRVLYTIDGWECTTIYWCF